MAKNSRPILSVLIEEEKRTKFADLARRHSLSMGWLVNQAIDRYIESDSIDIYRDSTERIPTGTPMGVSIENLLPPSADINELVKSYVDSLDIEELIKKSIETASHSTEQAIEELRSELSEISEKLQNLQKKPSAKH